MKKPSKKQGKPQGKQKKKKLSPAAASAVRAIHQQQRERAKVTAEAKKKKSPPKLVAERMARLAAEQRQVKSIEDVPLLEQTPTLAEDPFPETVIAAQKSVLSDAVGVMTGLVSGKQVQIGMQDGHVQLGLGSLEDDAEEDLEDDAEEDLEDDAEEDMDLEGELAFYEDPDNYPVMAAAVGGITILGGILAAALFA